MTPTFIEILATIFFSCAIAHTFLCQRILSLAHKRRSSVLHFLGEVEAVFGVWAILFLIFAFAVEGPAPVFERNRTLNFVEPIFVFAILVLCSMKPILDLALILISQIARWIPLRKAQAFYLATLTIGPLLGSFITEPAAMTVTALILVERFYSRNISRDLMFATIGLLFVNVSVGGTLTSFAAPPILMVAGKWNWDTLFVLNHFGWKGALSSLISTLVVLWRFRKELSRLQLPDSQSAVSPWWLIAVYLAFLAVVVTFAHHIEVFIPVVLIAILTFSVTRKYQTGLKIKEGALVAFFLAGLVVLGAPQKWWLEPIIKSLSASALYFGAMGLTAVLDNAAITYLGSQVEGISDSAKYFLVAGSVVGGGLTVIANAPNPAGFGILSPSFGDEGISPLKLFSAALVPTLIAAVLFFLF